MFCGERRYGRKFTPKQSKHFLKSEKKSHLIFGSNFQRLIHYVIPREFFFCLVLYNCILSIRVQFYKHQGVKGTEFQPIYVSFSSTENGGSSTKRRRRSFNGECCLPVRYVEIIQFWLSAPLASKLQVVYIYKYISGKVTLEGLD